MQSNCNWDGDELLKIKRVSSANRRGLFTVVLGRLLTYIRSKRGSNIDSYDTFICMGLECETELFRETNLLRTLDKISQKMKYLSFVSADFDSRNAMSNADSKPLVASKN